VSRILLLRLWESSARLNRDPENATGSIVLNTHNKTNNASKIANGVAAKTKGQEFIAREATSLVSDNGSPAFPNQLKKGTRVRLMSIGNSASSIHILTHPHISRGFVMRSGANTYRHRYSGSRHMHSGSGNMQIANFQAAPAQHHSTVKHVQQMPRAPRVSVVHPVHRSQSAPHGNHHHR
jgi:hypothetical protein